MPQLAREMRRQGLACGAYPAAIWHPAICLAATSSGHRAPNALHQTKVTWQKTALACPCHMQEHKSGSGWKGEEVEDRQKKMRKGHAGAKIMRSTAQNQPSALRQARGALPRLFGKPPTPANADWPHRLFRQSFASLPARACATQTAAACRSQCAKESARTLRCPAV